jgi:hypothetical protein
MGVSAGNLNLPKVLNLVGQTVGDISPAFDNHNFRGVHVGVNVTAVSGVLPVLTVYIEGQDLVSGAWYPVLVSSGLAAVGFYRLSVYPGISAPNANQAVSDVLPATWRIRWTITGTTAPSFSATFGACMLK